MIWDTFFFIILPYISLAMVIVVTIYRLINRPFSVSSLSSQLLERKKLYWGSVPFHYGIVLVLLGHLFALLLPQGLLLWNSIPIRLYLLELTGLALGIWALVGLCILLWRRLSEKRVQSVTTPMDLVVLGLIILSALTGVLIATLYRFGTSWFAVIFTPYLLSLLTLQPNLSLVTPLPDRPYAREADATLAEARHLWRALGRENVLIKVPGTREALPAIRQLLSEGVNVNVTLLFSRDAYAGVAEAHLAALEDRAARGEELSRLASVASFFVSRVDTLVDALLEELAGRAAPGIRERAEALRGRVAIANAKLAYQDWRSRAASPRWERLSARGARPQRLLWASTSTKNPRYRDVMYVEELIGPDTVDTVPPATFEAFRDHGRVRPTLEADVESAQRTMSELEALGISIDDVTDRLLAEGLRLFAEPFAKLLSTIETRRAAAVGPTASP